MFASVDIVYASNVSRLIKTAVTTRIPYLNPPSWFIRVSEPMAAAVSFDDDDLRGTSAYWIRFGSFFFFADDDDY